MARAMRQRMLKTVGLLSALLLVSSCGGSSSSAPSSPEDPGAPPTEQPNPPDPTDPTDPTDPDPGSPSCDVTYDSTYDAIQDLIFERRGCTAEACHGSGAAGGLDLQADVSYDNLFEAPSSASELSRVHPGTKERSFLWWKLLAATDDTVEIAGSPMPLGTEPLSDDELELLRLWITAGAPAEGTVLETEALVDGCLPEPEPIMIQPLAAPAPNEGIQIVMPPWPLPASSEDEVCFATWFDLTDEIPDEFKADANWFMYDTFEIRQDPSSHHLLIQAPIQALLAGEEITPELVEGWACLDGPRDGESCDPLDENACGDGGWCISPIQSASGCTGYSPARNLNPSTFSGTQQAQFRRENFPGVFSFAPMRGLIFWNSHAFNLTTSDTRMNARANFHFATDRRYQLQGANEGFAIFRLMREGAPPYTEKVMCSDIEIPQGGRLTSLGSHTHKRGKHFWFELPSGEHIYDSFVYNDPLTRYFDPPMEFDQEDPAERTLTACSLFNNGLDEDGNPDPETVTRASRIPYGITTGGSESQLGFCEPTQCVNPGRTHIECDDGIENRAGDDAACDSSPGAGDGFCDACQIWGGVTTENEMFGPSASWFVIN